MEILCFLYTFLYSFLYTPVTHFYFYFIFIWISSTFALIPLLSIYFFQLPQMEVNEQMIPEFFISKKIKSSLSKFSALCDLTWLLALDPDQIPTPPLCELWRAAWHRLGVRTWLVGGKRKLRLLIGFLPSVTGAKATFPGPTPRLTRLATYFSSQIYSCVEGSNN